MNFVKLTRLLEYSSQREAEIVNLDHATTITRAGDQSVIYFGDPGLETSRPRLYAESPDEIMARLFAEGWRS